MKEDDILFHTKISPYHVREIGNGHGFLKENLKLWYKGRVFKIVLIENLSFQIVQKGGRGFWLLT